MDEGSIELSPKKDAADDKGFVTYHEAPFGERLMTRGNLRLMLSAGATLTLGIMGRYKAGKQLPFRLNH